MRIAFDTFNLNATIGSGNKTYTIELIKALCRLNTKDRFDCVTYWRKSSQCAHIFGSEPQCTAKGTFPHPLLLGRNFRQLVKSTYPMFERFLARNCDLFHCTNPDDFLFTMPRVVTTIHDMIAFREETWAPEHVKQNFRRSIGTIINKSALLFANSSFTRDQIAERFPDAADRVIVTPLAADPIFVPSSHDRAFLRRYGISDAQRPYLLSVGAILPRKNTLTMIKVFESLCARYSDCCFLIIGQTCDGAYAKEIADAIASPSLSGRVRVLSNVPKQDLVLFYSNAIAMVYYSFFEGFGLPIIEAMACGCPVAASGTSSMTEIASGAAVMVDPYDFNSMRDGMTRILDEPLLREELRAKGLLRAQDYSWKKTAEITHAGYHKVIR